MSWSVDEAPCVPDDDDEAPPVIAVVATLDALAGQDYPGLRIVATLDDDPPSLDEPAHETPSGLRVSGAGSSDEPGFLLFCRDGVRLEPGAVWALVRAARATGAGIVGPKLVTRDAPHRLVDMGYAVAKTAVAASTVERNELDQGQHDGTCEVFALPGACLLVRVDVLGAIGGVDPAIEAGTDGDTGALSLCWRARVAGAAVVVTSDAVARVDLPAEAPFDAAHRRRLARHRLRVVLSAYGRRHVLRVLPQVVVAGVVGSTGALLAAQPLQAGVPWSAWAWNLRRWRSLLAMRRQVRRSRQVPDRTVRRLQVPGLVRPRLAARREMEGSAAASVPRPVAAWADALRARWTSGGVVATLALFAVLTLGSRHLTSRGVPEVGDLLPLGPDGVTAGTSARTGLGALRVLVTVGLIPLGVVGMFTALRPTGSPRAPVAAAVAYAALPMPYAALASGQWAPLAVYAVAPWWTVQLGLLAAPGYGYVYGWAAARPALVLGVLTAVAATVVPAAPLLLAGMGLALAVGSLLAFRVRGVARTLVCAVGGALVGVVLHLPWAVDPASPGSPWHALRELVDGRLGAPVFDVEPVDLLGFGVGRPEVLPWLWALPLAAVIPLVVGKRGRLAGAIRAWVVAMAAWAALLMGRAGIGAPLPDVEVLLVIAGVGIAGAVGFAAAAVEQDMAAPRRLRVRRRDRRRWRPPTHTRRVGWRGLTAAVGATAVAVAAVPLLRASLDGYWGMPRGDFGSVLAFVDEDVAASGGRILWLGDSAVVPLRQDALAADPAAPAAAGSTPAGVGSPGRSGDESAAGSGGGSAAAAGDDGRGMGSADRAGTALALTDRLPRLQDRWHPASAGLLARTRDAVEASTAHETSRLGQALAPLGVEYVVVPQSLAPSPFGPPTAPTPAVVDALDGQFDLQRVNVDPAVVIYRNLEFERSEDVVPPAAPRPEDQPEPSPWKLRLGLTAWGAVLLGLAVVQRRRSLAAEHLRATPHPYDDDPPRSRGRTDDGDGDRDRRPGADPDRAGERRPGRDLDGAGGRRVETDREPTQVRRR